MEKDLLKLNVATFKMDIGELSTLTAAVETLLF